MQKCRDRIQTKPNRTIHAMQHGEFKPKKLQFCACMYFVCLCAREIMPTEAPKKWTSDYKNGKINARALMQSHTERQKKKAVHKHTPQRERETFR